MERTLSRGQSARTGVVWNVLRAELERAGRPLRVVDVGGGTGGFAIPLAEAGHAVTLVDPSPDALAAATRRAADANVRLTAVQGDADGLAELIEPGSVDLVLCHAVLEIVDDPHQVAAALAASLRPGGAASVVVANRAAAVLARAAAGRIDEAAALLRGEGRRRYDAQTAAALLSSAGLRVEATHGVRVIADLVPGQAADADPEALLEFELAAAALPPYRDIATQLHLLARA
ncbi:class I SAM-dependent methyltransferase [Hamadaea tsunoensis]|uniref:class I SAM-dependent methyltransferase n=1 Tax=Hamadaea tsunoensis TaxID=53368 RepID=UPI000486EE29|nr:methyltransferase domain-containing protein [Hamadaea tsunoensis]